MKKYFNLILALILSLGTLPAITVLTINMMSLSHLQEYIGHKPYMLMVIYSDAPLCFACAYIAQRIFRLPPLFFAVVFVLLKTFFRLLYIYFIAYSLHFWAESTLSLILAIAGARLAFRVNEKENMNKAIQPVIAAISTIATPLLAWLVTLSLCTVW